MGDIIWLVNRGATKPSINAVEIKGIGKIQLALTEGLLMIFEKLGRPECDMNSATFWIMVDNIVNVWFKVFPYEVEEFKQTVSEQKEDDRGIKESLKTGIGNQYAIPAGLFKMMRAFWPSIPFTDKNFIHKFTQRYPFTKTTKANL